MFEYMQGWYDALKKCGAPENSAAQMAGYMAIAIAIQDGFQRLTTDRALGALDLHTVHIESAINDLASAIRELPIDGLENEKE